MTCPSQPGSMNPAVEWMSNPSRPSELLPSRRATRSSGKRDPLEGRSEDELTRMEDERLVSGDLDELGQLLLLGLHVDVRIAGVTEYPEIAVDAHVEARGLHQRGVERLDPDPALVDQPPDCAVGENHAAILRAPRALRLVTTRHKPQAPVSTGGHDDCDKVLSRCRCCSHPSTRTNGSGRGGPRCGGGSGCGGGPSSGRCSSGSRSSEPERSSSAARERCRRGPCPRLPTRARLTGHVRCHSSCAESTSRSGSRRCPGSSRSTSISSETG